MAQSKIKIVQSLLLGILFQIFTTSCTYSQLPGFASTVTYGSKLEPKDLEHNGEEYEKGCYPMTENPYSN
ncbi:MAG: hypothetical protein H0T62_08020 [Parachlamydiaceae bacterium]|nr:hypothetical protein [Parachlamydiaceae bacterium]